MEQQARVRKCNADGTALVGQGACIGSCCQCSSCGGSQKTVTLLAANPENAQPGELVLVRSRPRWLLPVVLYLLSVPGFFAGYWLGALLWHAGPVTGCLVCVACTVVAVIYDRCKVSGRESGYIIVRYPQNINKGDNEFD